MTTCNPYAGLSCQEILTALCDAYNQLLLSGGAGVAMVRLGGEEIRYQPNQMGVLKEAIQARHNACPIDASAAILGVQLPSAIASGTARSGAIKVRF